MEGLSIDQQMKISQDYNRKSPEEKLAANKKTLGTIKKVKREKDTRTDAQKMTDALVHVLGQDIVGTESYLAQIKSPTKILRDG